jgi:hypothetical protein
MKKIPDFCCHGDCQQSRLCPRERPVNLRFCRSLSDAFVDSRANAVEHYKASLWERIARRLGLWGRL